MKTRLAFASLLVMMLFASESFSQGDTRSFDVAVDYSRFRGDSSRAYLEVCYSFFESQLSYVQEGEKFRGEVLLDLTITPVGETEPVVRRPWLAPHVVDDTTSLKEGKGLIGVVGFGVEAGKYKLKFVARDNVDGFRTDSAEFTLDVMLFDDPDKVMVSDVQLCSTIRQSKDQESIFYKNTLEVIPNAGGLYGVGMPVLYYYAEAYNLLKGIQSDKYVVLTAVYDAFGKEVMSRQRKKLRMNESSVEVGTIKVGSFRQGAYTLVFSVIDTVSQYAASSLRRFFVYNPASVAEDSVAAEALDLLASEYAVMDEAQLDQEFDQCRYIRTDVERSQYRSLKGADAKRRFLRDFWGKRDPNPFTAVNEIKSDYFARVSYANENFRTAFRKGWKTDQGRVYIMYGPPDEYDLHPNEIDSKPYEIWYYHRMQGGVEFIFVDKTGFDDYELIHSTHRNELRDDNWRLQVRAN